MDTQGLYDKKTEKSLNTQIFALSTLLSSVQILNLSHQIQEDYLEFLEFFTEYATKAKDRKTAGKPFQSLLFLIRDWTHYEDNEYGLEGGKSYMDEVLDPSQCEQGSSLQVVRRQIYDSFESIQCFLMPFPGMKVCGAKRGYTFKGCLKDIDEDFLDELGPLADTLLHPRAGESGKSTFVKQMKIIHNAGFSEEERFAFKPAILDNLLNSMKFVLQGMAILRINLQTIKNKVHAHTVLCSECVYDEDTVITARVATALRNLWRDRGVRTAAKQGFEYELNDSALYYFNHIRRLTSPDYIPTVDDVLRVRIRTMGVMESQFRFTGILFKVFDVGGQRTERRKWIACFDHVRAVLFVAALSGYDMTLLEDSSVNRLRESLKLFGSICNNAFFKKTSVILFLNKLDLFEKKIRRSKRHLRFYFPEYEGRDGDVEASAEFIKARFLELNKNEKKTIYPHYTTATNTQHIEMVFDAVIDTVIRENLESASLL